MFTNRLTAQVCTATMLLVFSFTLPALGGDKDCADIPQERVIERIPFEVIKRSTCIPDPGEDVINLESYAADQGSKSCPLVGVRYPGHDVIYKVKLNKGNEVAFLLTPDAKDATKPDLVLTLITACDDGLSCVSSSPDFIGSGKEEIPAAQYKEGVYYLVVDSFYTTDKESCGDYSLKVTGVNPTPDLSLEIKTDSKRAVAGEDLVYTLTISNSGDGKAQGVKLTLDLPPGVTSNDEVEWNDITIPPREDENTPGKWTIDITAAVGQHLDGKIIASAKAELSGYPPAQDALTTAVDHIHDLSVHLSALRDEAIAGRTRTYTLTLKNDGPSNATNVTVTDTLDKDECFPETDCSFDSIRHQIIFEHLDLEAHTTQSRTFTVLVNPSATTLSNEAVIKTSTGSEPDRNKGSNTARLTALVGRETDLFIEPIKTTRPEPIPAGAKFNYVIPVRNHGPSDSSGGTVTVELSGSLCLVGPNDECQPVMDSITYPVPPMGAADKKDIVFAVRTSADLGPAVLSSTAQVTSNETDPVTEEKQTFTTEFNVQADLRVTKVEATDSVCEGENVFYTIKVHNDGDSDSSKGTVTNRLDGLSFVASPDGCEAGKDNSTVICPAGNLPADGEKEFHFRALTTQSGTVKNMVSAKGENDPDPEPGVEEKTTVASATDLEVALRASKDPLSPDEDFTYEVIVTNHGPSVAEDISVEVTLPDGVTSESAEDCIVCDSPCTLPFETIAAGGVGKKTICARAPSQFGEIPASASIVDRPCDPNENETTLITSVAAGTDTDLSVTLTADKKIVSRGDLTYTLVVVNRGFGQAEGVTVDVTLPVGVCLIPEDGCALQEPKVVSYSVDPLAAYSRWTKIFTATAHPEAGGRIETSAVVSAATVDPNTTNNRAEVITQRTAPLVAPFVEVDADTGDPAASFTLKNASDATVSLRYDVFLTGEITPRKFEVDLPSKATKTINLIEELPKELGLQSGFVEIAPIPAEVPVPFEMPIASETELPSGDFIQLGAGTAAGERLIATDTGLCRSWSVRFLDGLPEGSSTELLFFVPGHESGVAATGRIFTEAGAYAETFYAGTIEAVSSHGAFRYLVHAPVYVPIGSIEWTFNNDFVGSITAVHTLRNGDKVAVPGFCRDHAGAQTLILPFVQTNEAINTHIAVRNETDDNAHLKITYPGGEEASHPIAAHALRIVNLRALRGEVEGALKVEAFKSADETEPIAALSGDFIRVGPDGLAGSALVKTPARRCTTRFAQDTQDWKTTHFLVYIEEQGAPPPTVAAYDAGGTPLAITPPDNTAQSFLVSASKLGLSGSGSIEWDFGEDADGGDRKGYVAMLLSGEGGQSVLIPGACLPEEETPEEPQH